MGETNLKKPRLWKKIVRGLLDIIVAISLLAAVLTSVLVHGVLDVEKLKDSICDQNFDNVVKETVLSSIRSNSSIIELDSEQLFIDADMGHLVLYAREYTKEFIESVYSNKKFEPKPFEDQKYKEAVIKQLNAIGELTDEEINEICDEAMKNMQNTLQYIPLIITNNIQVVSPILLRISVLKFVEVPLYFFGFIMAVINFIFGGKKHRLDVFYGLSASCFIAFITVFIPTLMLSIYNVPKKIVLSESLLLYFIKGLNEVLVVDLTVVFAICIIVFSVMLGFSITLLAKNNAKKVKCKNDKKTVDKSIS